MNSFNNNEALYIQIGKKLIERIYLGEIKVGDELESVRTLSQRYNVTIRTVQNTLDYLEELGIVRKKVGVGVTIITTLEKIKEIYDSYALEYTKEYIEKMKTIGFDNDTIKYIEKVRSALAND